MAVTIDLTRYAVDVADTVRWAPSHHNAQPWALRVRPDAVEVHLDRDRAVPLADPAGRQAHLGVGAAVFAVRLHLARLGVGGHVTLLPDPGDPLLAATVDAGPPRPPTDLECALFAEIARRHTVREAFAGEPVPRDVRIDLAGHARAEGARLRWVEQEGERRGLAGLVAQAERMQRADPAFRAELRRWVGPDATARAEGIAHRSLGPSGSAGHAAEFAPRDFGGARPPQVAVRRPEDRPVITVLHTAGDDRVGWLRGGQGLMRILLAASRRGIYASYLNQPLEHVNRGRPPCAPATS